VLGGVMAITQWVLPSSLAAAMGYRYPGPNGQRLTMSIAGIGASSWYSLDRLIVVPVLLGVIVGAEAARSANKFVSSRWARPIEHVDYRVAFAASAITVAVMLAFRGAVAAAGAGAVLFFALRLESMDPKRRLLASPVDLPKNARRWGLPADWQDTSPIALLLLLMIGPPLWFVVYDVGGGIWETIRFPFDRVQFFSYWITYSPARITPSPLGIFGPFQVAMIALALFFLMGAAFTKLIKVYDKRNAPFLISLIRIGGMALILLFALRATDHLYATPLFGGELIIVSALVFGREWAQDHLGTLAVAVAALVIYAVLVWETSLLPAAIVLAAAMFQRFVLNSDKLNDNDPLRSNRIWGQVSLYALLAGMLVLDHAAAKGFFDSDALSTVGDHVAIPLVALPWLMVFTTRSGPVVTRSSSNASTM
jgi:hypothetical protein